MTAEEFCRYVWQKYLVERRYDLFGEILDERLSVIGTGAHEFSRTLEEFIASMDQECSEWNGSFVIKDQWYQTIELSDAISLVIGEIAAKEDAHDDGILYDFRFRFSAVIERSGDSWRVIHVHQSVPDTNQSSDEFFPHRMVEENVQQVIYNLRHDSLTGLLNRLYLKETVDRSMIDTPEGYLLMMDIDKFKQLNDKYGHPFGDKVLILFSQCLKSSFPNAIIGRVGGDEFVAYMPKEAELENVDYLFGEFKNDWMSSQKVLRLSHPITVSIGVAQCPVDGWSYDEVWSNADKALYIAKRNGDCRIHYLHC